MTGKGMPHYGDSSKFGNLYIHINVDFNTVSLTPLQLESNNFLH